MESNPDSKGYPLRNATVTALENTHVCALTRAQLKELIRDRDLPASVLDDALVLGRRRSVKLMRKLSRRVTVVADLEHEGKLWQSHHHGKGHVKPTEEIIHIKTWSRQIAEGNAENESRSSGSSEITTPPTYVGAEGKKEGAGKASPGERIMSNGDLELEDA